MGIPSDILEEWQTKLKSCAGGKSSTAPLLTICGPSGSGKTAIVRTLLQQFNGYVEAAEENPYLLSLLEGKSNFNAFANQQWFLNRIREFVHNASSRSPLILDQDPAAIVMVYSRIFREDGLIDNAGSRTLLTDLLHLEEMMSRWRTPREIFFLDAPAKVLRDRVLLRAGNVATPPLKWFTRIRHCFRELSAQLSNVTFVSTDGLTPQQISNQVAEVLGAK